MPLSSVLANARESSFLTSINHKPDQTGSNMDDERGAAGASMAPERTTNDPNTLKRALNLPGVLLQGLTHVAPAAGLIFGVGYIASLAGVATPISALLAGLIALTLAVSLTQLAKHLPSSGGYFTYVSRGVSPSTGWLTAWLSFIWYPLNPPGNLIFAGMYIDESLRAYYGIHIPWWLFLTVLTLVIGTLMYRGIVLSIRVLMGLAVAELLILFALGLSGVISPGPGGVNGTPFEPSHALSGNGLFLGVIFFISNYAGFESVAPLGEEAQNPRRTVPRALMLTVGIATLIYVFDSYAFLTAWGTSDVGKFASSVQSPVFVIARHLWGAGWVVVLFALFTSVFALAMAASNASTRMLFNMSRAGAMPKAFSRLHPRHRTPINAIIFQSILTIVVGLALGEGFGVQNGFFLFALVSTLGLLFVYVAGNIAVAKLFLTERRGEFRFTIHLLFPVVSTAAIVYVLYKSLIPLPAYPNNLAPWVVLVWLVLGVIALVMARRSGRVRLLTAFEEAVVADEPALLAAADGLAIETPVASPVRSEDTGS
jgi:amino acid transporter